MGDAIKHGFGVPDNGLLKLGDDSDGVLLLRSAVLGADTALGSVLVGTVESQAIAGNSVMVANTTTDGDIALYTSKGGNSQMGLWLDGSAGDAALMAASGASVDHYIAGAKVLDHSAGAFAFQEATTISSTGAITINGVTSVVFNETGADVDFRVEGDNNQNMIAVDAGLDAMGIGLSADAEFVVKIGKSFLNQGANRAQVGIRGSFSETSAATALAGSGLDVGTGIASGNTQNWTNATVGLRSIRTYIDLGSPAGVYTITGVAGLQITEPTNLGSAVITKQYGIYIPNLTVGGSDYGIYIAGADTYAIWVDAGVSRFDGDIGATAARVPMIYTTSQTTTNAETVDSWGMTKQHITPYDDALAVLRNISVVAYEHKSTYDPSGRRKLGVLAESVGERMVTPFDEYVGLGQGPRLDMLGLAAINTRAIQQVDGEVEALRARVAFLESRLNSLEVPNATDPD